jgi:hypothetical protein
MLVIGCAKQPPGPTVEIQALGALPTGPLASGGR